MNKIIKTISITLLCTLSAIGIITTTIYTTLNFANTKTDYSVNMTVFDINSYISEISELDTAEGIYNVTDKTEKAKELFGHKVPFTTNSVTYKYSGKVKAGIDVSKIKTRTTKTCVYVTLPNAEILSNEIDNDSLEILDEKKSIFNPYSFSEFNICLADLKTVGEKKVIENGILEEAKLNAKIQLENLLIKVCDKENLVLSIN